MDQESKTVFIVEDDAILSSLIKEYLEQQDYNILTEARGDRAVARIQEEPCDLVILDLMLPGKDGLSVCRDLRPVYNGPILVLTAKEDDMDQVAALEMGADDYVKKPVKPRVLLARIRALFRRSHTTANEQQQDLQNVDKVQFGSLKINVPSRIVLYREEKINLSTFEFEVLWLLASNYGKILARDEISRATKGYDWDGADRSIDMAVSKLRKKLHDNPDDPTKIKTVWGIGYLFVKDAWE